MESPLFALVRQKLASFEIKDIAKEVEFALSSLDTRQKVKTGDTVAVAVGSRGIDRIDEVTLHCIHFLREIGLKPFIVPAMGSHGGATAPGQKDVLENLGITEHSMGASIHPEMSVKSLGKIHCGMKVLLSKAALKAEHIVLINRIKPHTKFKAEIESGLCKMMAVGLGKSEGASLVHKTAVRHSFDIIRESAELVIKKCNILFGLGLIEDALGKLAKIEAISPEAIIKREASLLKDAKAKMGHIPFNHIDILIIDYMGKNISGIGMDSNVTGRNRDITGSFNIPPEIGRIFVRDLSPDSGGNANGIGLADFTTKRLAEAIDRKKTAVNALTAISPEKAAIPLYFESDIEAIEACAMTAGIESIKNARVVRIKDTKSLEVLQVSKAFEHEILNNKKLEIISPWKPLCFDGQNNLKPLQLFFQD